MVISSSKQDIKKKMYLHLLILCGIWSQGFIGTFADEEIKESSNFHVRQKRVISRIPGEDKVVSVRNVQYIVQIKYDYHLHCAGSILSHYVVITSTSCTSSSPAPSEYQVLTGASRASRGKVHNVTDIIKHYGNHPYRPSDGIALLTIDPPFVYGQVTRHIELHSGSLLPGTIGIVSGWGFNCRSGADRGTDYPRDLRSIQVPILSHRDCVHRYRPHYEISDVDICTYHPQRQCGHTDWGAPLVIDGFLAGVFLWSEGRDQHSSNYPDVFVVLQHSAYNHWIRTNVQNIGLQFQNNSP